MPPQNTPASVPAAAAGSGAAALPGDTIIQVDDKLYSAEKLAASHPGGELFVRAFAGKDATDAFLSYHRRNFPHQLCTSALVGTKSPVHLATFDKDYLELCNIIDTVLPRHKSFAPPQYFLKIFVILGAAVTLEGYMHVNQAYHWYLFAPLGFLMALIGLNIQHDANHGSISRNSAVNRALGLTQNWIGGSALDWIHQHVVQHHVATNEMDTDPDIAGNPLVRINPKNPLMKFHAFQNIYVFFLLFVFGLSYSVNSVIFAIKFGNFTKYSKMLRKYQATDLFNVALFHFRLTLLPLLRSGDRSFASTLLNILPLYVVGGFYLSLFFLISHNFEGAHFFDKKKETKSDESFLYAQVTSSSNVGGWWLCLINGGLNYQIEHHLFPRIQHMHYPKIAPYVKQYCKTKGIPYVHFDTLGENLRSTANHLLRLGTEENPLKFG